MKAVNNYLKNVMKSVAYAAADVSGDYLSSVHEFSSTNKEFATATYAALKNPAQAVRKSVQAIQESKIYKALDYGARNLSEDHRTGNFYNKERKDRDELAFSGLDTNWDDLSDFDIDSDWESKSSSSNDEVTAGDLKVIESIEGSNAALAHATVNAVITSSQNEIKNSRINTGLLYEQNERLFGGLHKDMSILGSTMQQMYKLQSASLQNMDKNMSSFFTQESKLSAERNAILKEMLEMQRNMYKSASDREKDANAKRKSGRIRWNDINTNGMVDISAYFGAVKKNINSQLSTIMPAGFGEDSNMLATFMTSPLEGAMKYVVNGVIPATVKAAAKEFDSSLSGVFGNIIGELGNARSKNEGGLLGTIAKFLGISTSVNRNIDTSRYEKGPVPFDGITRKAIIDVIPTHLRRIEAAITGRPEEMFDYRAGRWVKVSTVKKQYEDIKKSAVKRATSDLREAMNPGLQAVRKGISNKSDQDSWDMAIEEFEQFIYDNNGRFNPKVTASKNGISSATYPNLYKHYNKIKTIFKDFDKIESKDRNGKLVTRNTRNSIRMKLSNSVLDARDAEEKQYREIESDIANVIQSYFGGPNADAHGKYRKSDNKFEAYNMLKDTTDKLGNSIFDYLQNINKELTWFRLNGVPGGGNGGPSGRGVNQVSMDQIQKQLSKSTTANNNYNKELAQRDQIRKSALDTIASGKAIDLRDFDVDEQAYLLQLSAMMKNNAVNEYKSEIEGYNSNELSSFMDKHFFKTNIKSIKDIDAAIKKADKEGKNTNEVNMDAKEEKFFSKIMNRIGSGETILGGIVGASSEAFTNLLYTADKAIYEMMYKTEIKDDDKKKYNGFMDAMVGKMSDGFKKISEQFQKDFIDPLKERLGIDDSFEKRFKDGLFNTGSRLWTSFKDANTAVYGPAYHDMMAAMGFEDGQTKAQKKRAVNRGNLKSKIKKATDTNNLYDDDFYKLLREYGLNFADYKTVDDAKAALLPLLYEDMYKNSNELREFDDGDMLDMALKTLINNPDRIQKTGKRLGFNIQGDTDQDRISYIKKQIYNRRDNSVQTRRDRQTAVSKGSGASDMRAILAEDYGFTGSIEQKQEMLKALAREFNVTISNISKYDNDDALNKAYIRIIENHNARGTVSGRPFTGLTTLTKGEGLISGRGVGIVPKTGVYNVTSPTHIINTEDMHSITGGPRVSVQQALGKEKLAAKSAGFNIAHHDEGTIKITNKGVSVDSKEFLEEAKRFIPEAAGGGLIGGILSMILGIAGGPLLGAAVGAGGSIISNSDMLKEKLFGKAGSDGKRDGSGIVSKSIMDAYNKYFPDMAKYGLAGIIPGLITPLGPIGGLMAGAAFGFLKNNERFTNKYFGEEGKLTIKTKERKIIEDLLPGALKGAGAGAVLGVLFGGPFGLLGNAALGSGLGMMASTEEFKDLILGTEINGERVGGILGVFKDAAKPFTDSMKNAGKKLIDAFDKHLIDPLANFMTPAIHALPKVFGAIPKLLNDKIDNYFKGRIGRTLETFMNSALGKPIRGIGKVASGAASVIGKGMAIPGAIINRTGDKLRAFNIRQGDTMDMTQQEAVEWMDSTGRSKQVSALLRASSMVGSGLEGSLSKDEAESLRNSLLRMNDTEDAARKNFKGKNAELNKLLTAYQTADGKKLSDKQIKLILEAANNKDYTRIADILQNRTLAGSKTGMTKAEFNSFMEEGGLKAAVVNAADAKTRLSNISKISDEDAMNKAEEALAALGISEKDFDLNDKKQRAKFASLLSEQLTHLDAVPGDNHNKLEEENNENIERATTAVENILKIMLAEHSGNTDAIKKAVSDAEAGLHVGKENANKKYDKNIEKATKGMGVDAINLDEQGLDNLSVKRNRDIGRKYGSKVVNNSTSDMSNIEKVFSKHGIKAFTLPEKIHKAFTPEAISYVSELVKYDALILSKSLNNKFIHRAIIDGGYKITPNTIKLLCNSVAAKELSKRCTFLDQIYNKPEGKDIYSRYDSLEEIANLTLAQMYQLRNEFGIAYASSTSSVITNIGRSIKSAPDAIKGIAGKISNYFSDDKVESHGIGTMLLGAGKSLLTGAGSLIKSLFNKNNGESDAIDGNSAGVLSSILGAGKSLVGNAAKAIAGNTDEVDKSGDGKDVLPLGDGYGVFRRDSSGNVQPDTSDSHTKSLLNKLEIKEQMSTKLQEAQLKAAELIKTNFDTSGIKGSNKGKLGWLSLLIGGGLLYKSGILQKVFDGLIKPVWTDHIKPWINDTAIPWIEDKWTNKVKPWLIDTAIPAIGTALQGALEILAKELPSIIAAGVKELPGLIAAAIKGGASVLDATTGNKYNAGSKTTVDASSLTDKYGANFTTGMYDEYGNALTVEDIQNGNFNKIYNAQGAEGIVNEDGTVTFKDGSLKGASYANTVINAGAHGFAKSLATGRNSLFTKAAVGISNKLAKSKKGPLKLVRKLTGYTGKALFKPVQAFENLGVKSRKALNNIIDDKAINLMDKLVENGMSNDDAINLVLNGDNSKVSKIIKNVADYTDNGIVGRATDKVGSFIDNAKNAVSGIKTKAKNLFKTGAKETVGEAAEKVVKNSADDIAKASAKNGKYLPKLLEKASKAIDDLFSNSTVQKKLVDVAESLGVSSVDDWIKGFKGSIDNIFGEALEQGTKKVGSETCKKVISKFAAVVFLVADFLFGCDQAESILGVKETTLVEELVAGLINALCNLLIIPSIIPGTNWIARKIYGLFDKDLESRQSEATKEYEAYKEATGSTLTSEEYLKRQNSLTGKVGGWISDKVGGAAKSTKNWLSDHGFRSAANKIPTSTNEVMLSVLESAPGFGDIIRSFKKIKKVGNVLKDPLGYVTNGFNNIKSDAGKIKDTVVDSLGGLFGFVSGNANGTISLSNSNNSSGLLSGFGNIIGNLTKGFNLKDVDRTIDKAANGSISVFSKEYWRTPTTYDNSLKGVIQNAYAMLTKLINLPVLMIKDSIGSLSTNVEEVGNAITGTTSSSSTSIANKTSTITSSSTIGSKLKGFISGAVNKVKDLLGFGTGNYRYGTGKYSKQIDPSIANIRFNTSADSEYQTIGNSGCGPAAAVNAIESMYGRGNAVLSAAKYAINRGYKEPNGGTKPGFFSDYFNSNGLNSRMSYNRSDIERSINNGMPTVLMGKDARGTSSSTPFGKTPHYVTVTGIDGRGNAIVQDPESRYDNQLYPLKSLMKNTTLGVSAYGKNYRRFGRGRWGRGTDANIWWYLKQMGLTDTGAAGLMGNLYAESGLRSNNVENLLESKINMSDEEYTKAIDNGTINKSTFLHPMGGNSQYGYGLAQWTSPGRKEGLYKLAKDKKVSIADLGMQLEWLNTELSKSYSSVLKVLKSSKDLATASNTVLTKFEAPADQSSTVKSKRISYGQKYLSQFKGTTGEELSGSVVAVGDTDMGSDSTGSESNATDSILSKLGSILSNSKAGQALNMLLGTSGSLLSSGDSSGDNTSDDSPTGSGDAASVVNIAKGEVGTKEKSPNYVKYNDWFWGDGKGGNSLPWCAAFVSWVANQAGVSTDIIPKDAYTVTAYNSILKKGKKVDNSKAKPGDIIYFTKNGTSSGIYHTGIVTGNSNGKISTVEGNSSDMVAERSYNASDSKVLIARPKYANAGEATNYTNNVAASDVPDVANTRGSNGVKPLSRYGQFKDSIYGRGKVQHRTKDGYVKVEESTIDAQLGRAMKSYSRKNVYSEPKVITSGMGTGPNYSKLINSIISILMTIADNTDKLNLIVNILNNKLNLDISASDVSNATTDRQNLKSKLSSALNNINNSSNLSKLNTYADSIGDNSINSIIMAMNAIASE